MAMVWLPIMLVGTWVHKRHKQIQWGLPKNSCTRKRLEHETHTHTYTCPLERSKDPPAL